MARPRPFLLCRNQLLVDDQPLDARGQLMALKELQGQYVAVSAAAERNKNRDSAIFRPRRLTADKEPAIAWSVGRRVGMRVTVEPDRSGATLELKAIPDTGIHCSDFVVIPRLAEVPSARGQKS
jgi:hypothetical protein